MSDTIPTLSPAGSPEVIPPHAIPDVTPRPVAVADSAAVEPKAVEPLETPKADPFEMWSETNKRALLRWGIYLALVSTLFGVVVSVSDLRTVDPIFVPTTALFVVACLVAGFFAGKFFTLWRLRRQMRS